jgi:8-oxo-dGTP pyrophosphatase MutT (NUDIX family)
VDVADGHPGGTSPTGSAADRDAGGHAGSADADSSDADTKPAASVRAMTPGGGGTVPVEEANPWHRRSRRVAYENAWIRVLHDEVTRPDGQPGVYGVVHFRTRAVGVLALDDQDRILLVGQYRYTLDRYSWELPEGGVPEGEDLLDGARRELEEETGFRAERWRSLIPATHLSNSVTDESGTLYVAEELTGGPARPEGTERLELRWVTLDEAVRLVDAGRITDSMSQVAILRYALERQAAR